uniref:DMT family transporter n=1 Tax=Marinobacterium profundum TaxID=1714300 RepID=UPI0008316B65|nr:multidrug efflux SMR transporter [Marinobacterium profundum]
MHWFYLIIAIVAEVIGTSALKAADGFTRPGPSALVVVAYGISFLCLSLTLRTLPVGIAYAVWSGVGVVLVTIVAWFLYQQRLDWPAVLGIGLILSGVMVLNLFSNMSGH